MTDRLSMTEAELERWRCDNRYRLSYRPELEPPVKQVPKARLKLSKQRSASLAEGVFVADIAAMERCPLVRTCDQRGRASAGPGRDCLRPCSSRLGRPGIALGVPRTLLLSNCVAVAFWRKRDNRARGRTTFQRFGAMGSRAGCRCPTPGGLRFNVSRRRGQTATSLPAAGDQRFRRLATINSEGCRGGTLSSALSPE